MNVHIREATSGDNVLPEPVLAMGTPLVSVPKSNFLAESITVVKAGLARHRV